MAEYGEIGQYFFAEKAFLPRELDRIHHKCYKEHKKR